jgi:hypothetical protein
MALAFLIIIITHNFMRPQTSISTNHLLCPLRTILAFQNLLSCKKDTNFISKRLSLSFERLLYFINHLNIKNTITNYHIFIVNPYIRC